MFLIFRKILQELVASGDLDGDGGLSWEEFEGFGNFEFAANWFGYDTRMDLVNPAISAYFKDKDKDRRQCCSGLPAVRGI